MSVVVTFTGSLLVHARPSRSSAWERVACEVRDKNDGKAVDKTFQIAFSKVSPGLEVRRGSDDGQYLLKSLIEMMERAPMVACAPPQPLELPLPVG